MKHLILSGLDVAEFLEDLRAIVRHEVQHAQAALVAAESEGEQLLTIAEAAELLHVCRQTVHDYKRRGILVYHKLSGRSYLKKSEVLAALQGYRRTSKGAGQKGGTRRG